MEAFVSEVGLGFGHCSPVLKSILHLGSRFPLMLVLCCCDTWFFWLCTWSDLRYLCFTAKLDFLIERRHKVHNSLSFDSWNCKMGEDNIFWNRNLHHSFDLQPIQGSSPPRRTSCKFALYFSILVYCIVALQQR